MEFNSDPSSRGSVTKDFYRPPPGTRPPAPRPWWNRVPVPPVSGPQASPGRRPAASSGKILHPPTVPEPFANQSVPGTAFRRYLPENPFPAPGPRASYREIRLRDAVPEPPARQSTPGTRFSPLFPPNRAILSHRQPDGQGISLPPLSFRICLLHACHPLPDSLMTHSLR
jgi:hypothetical protein